MEINKIPMPFLIAVMAVMSAVLFETLSRLSAWHLSRSIAVSKKPEPIRAAAVKPVPVAMAMATVEMPQPVFRPLLLDIKPSPMRAFDFSTGKTEGRLVLFGEQPAKRFVMLWKGGGQCRFVRLQPIQISDLSQAISSSLEEAKDVAHKVFGKKQKSEHKADVTVPVISVLSKSEVMRLPVVNPVESVIQPVAVEKPVLKGFKTDWTGILMAEGSMEHATTKNGVVETYKAYTVKMNVNDEEVSVQGQDMKRALSEVGAKVGNKIHLIHVRTEPLEGGRSRKVFACSVLQ